MRRVLYKDEDIDYEFFLPKKENLDGKSGATDELRYSVTSS